MRTGLAPGTTLGPYQIQSPLGAGGMGEVYKARDTRLDRTVAIKILSPDAGEPVALRQQFEREARAISQLNHPHVCTLYDIGEQPATEASEHPVRYLVMEFLDGETLAARLERGPLPLDLALTYAIQIADALDKVHRNGIVHGDLKPGNIMLTRAGVKLLDFGLARQHRQAPPSGWPDASTQTVPITVGSVLGTLQYLAPEQLEGRESDARSDIFACGAVLYEMVTGQKAFPGDTHASVMASIMKLHPPRLAAAQPDAPPALEHLVATCLAKDPDDRWQHAGDLTRQLEWIVSGAPAAAPRVRARRAPVWTAAAAALLVVAGALGAYAYLLRGQTEEAPASRTSILLPEGLRFPGAGELGGIERFAISPDGRQIVFVAADANGNQLLWLRPLDSLIARPLPGTDNAASPFWSPDSRQIGFVARGQLKTTAAGGGLPTVVASPAANTSGSWNRDNIILFAPTAGSALHRVPAAGGTPEPATTLDEERDEILHRNPFFLPDGRHFLYVAVSAPEGEAAGARGLYVGSLDPADTATEVFASGSIAKYSQGRLLFVRDNRLLAQAFDPERLELSGEPRAVAEQIELIGPSSGAFTVSEAGVLAYQRTSGPGSQLVWFRRDGQQLSAVGDPSRYGDLELSPDGRQAIVSVLDPTTNTRDLWIFDVERGVRTKFTFDRSDEVAPIWSPDGRRVVFTSNRNGHFDLYQKPASGIGTDVLVHADDSEKYPIAWLLKEDAVLYRSFGAEGAGLSLVPIDGEESPKSVLSAQMSDGRLSPDGRWLAYSSSQSGRPEVYMVPYPDASKRWQVSSAGGSFPRWTRDSRAILFAARDNRLMSVTVEPKGGLLDVDVRAPQPLFDVRPVAPRSFFAPAPDGERVLVNMQQLDSGATSITVVQNWSAVLTP